DLDPDMKSVSSNMINNEDCKNQIIRINDKNTFECNTDSSEPNTDSSEPNTDSSESNTDSSEPNTDSSEPNTDSSESNTTGKVYNSRYKKLLDQMKRMQMNLMNSSTSLALYNTRDSSNSEQIQLSSCSHSSSTTSSTISSNDEQHEEDFRSQTSVRFTKLCNFTKPASTSSSDFSLDCDFKETRGLLSSENNSVASFNMDDPKQDQSVKIDSIVSNVDDSKQSNATAEMPRTSRMLQLVLKIAENATNDIELDSDDLSNQENVASDTSCDKKEYKSIDKLMVDRVRCKSMSNDINMHKKTFIPPVLNDCDIESDDSDWDCYVEPLIQLRHTEQTEISDNESGRI
ncbi:tudor domain-containing protein 5, partial [Lasius niger]